MLQQALQKLNAEIGSADKKNKYVPVIGGFLINYVRQHPKHASFILTEGKSIAGSLNALKEEARKNQSNGVGMLTDEEGFAVALKYFGVPKEPAQEAEKPQPTNFDLTLDDLL